MKITKMDKAAADLLAAEGMKALQEVAERYGVSVEKGRGKYDPSTGFFEAKYQFACDGRDEKDFARSCTLIGLKAEDFGRTFTHLGKTYQINGVNLRAPKFPVKVKCLEDGRGYKFPEGVVVRALQV